MTELSQEQQAEIAQFEQLRQQLAMVSAQKNQAMLQKAAGEYALEELAKSKEQKAFRAVGSVLVQLSKEQIIEELQGEIKQIEEGMETMNIQEKKLLERMEKLKKDIESNLKA